MSEISILAKNLIKSYFEEVGNEDTPILDKFEKLIAKYVKGSSCDACLTNINGYLNMMWDKGLNEKDIREFIEELTKYVDETTATKINKSLNFTESLEESLKESKESNLIEKVATKLKDEKIINGTIDTFRGADWFAISGKDSTIKVIYMRGELSIELYQNGEFQDGELEKASSLSDDDFSVNYVIDFIKNFLKVTKFNKNEFSIKESLKESSNGYYIYFDDDEGHWIYCDYKKGITDTANWYNASSDLFEYIAEAIHVFKTEKSAQKFIDEHLKYFADKDKVMIAEVPLDGIYEEKKTMKKSLKESKNITLSDLCDTLGISYTDISSIRYDDNKGTSYNCNEMLHVGIKILYNEAIQITGFGNFIGAFDFNKYEIYSESSYFILEDNKSRYLEIYLK